MICFTTTFTSSLLEAGAGDGTGEGGRGDLGAVTAADFGAGAGPSNEERAELNAEKEKNDGAAGADAAPLAGNGAVVGEGAGTVAGTAAGTGAGMVVWIVAAMGEGAGASGFTCG